MIKRILVFLLTLWIITVFQCGPVEPENKVGSLKIIVNDSSPNIEKKMDQLGAVQCILKKGNNVVSEKDLTNQ